VGIDLPVEETNQWSQSVNLVSLLMRNQSYYYFIPDRNENLKYFELNALNKYNSIHFVILFNWSNPLKTIHLVSVAKRPRDTFPKSNPPCQLEEISICNADSLFSNDS
jgi:hypothetical protein